MDNEWWTVTRKYCVGNPPLPAQCGLMTPILDLLGAAQRQLSSRIGYGLYTTEDGGATWPTPHVLRYSLALTT